MTSQSETICRHACAVTCMQHNQFRLHGRKHKQGKQTVLQATNAWLEALYTHGLSAPSGLRVLSRPDSGVDCSQLVQAER